MNSPRSLPACLLTLLLIGSHSHAQQAQDTSRGERMVAEYFRAETAHLRQGSLADVKSLADWQARREQYRRELFEMLSLDPLPEKTDLKATVTGQLDQGDFVVEKLHFQSRPGLYVTGNLYRPKEVSEPLPAILYLCGHGGSKSGDRSNGNKITYQHHGEWFARHGYVCLAIDSLQLGEIEATHHGTYRYSMWWWNARGYTPAGVEAWNCIRALDYLQTRKDVDPERIGATGRSGGGAYSWWIAALDDRIKVAVPVAGITDLENHVVDGCVEGHCDCMFTVNTYRWDYPQVAALVAPRPLLVANTDSDGIFPLDGVHRTFAQVRRIYRLHDAENKLGIFVTWGPHKDVPQLQEAAFRWFDKYLKGQERPAYDVANKFTEPETLRAFPNELPADRKNTEIHESFVPLADCPLPESKEHWQRLRDDWLKSLAENSFRGWPEEPQSLNIEQAWSATNNKITVGAFDFTSQGPFRLRLYVAHRADLDKPGLVVLNVLDEPAHREFLATLRPGFAEQLKDEESVDGNEKDYKSLQSMLGGTDWVMAYVAPRGVGRTAWDSSERKQTQIRRRFMLLGQTLDGMRVWDARRAIAAVRAADNARFAQTPLWLQSQRQMAGITLYASLFEPDIKRLDLYELPASHRSGPIFLNVLRYLDLPQAVALAAERSQVVLYDGESDGRWSYPRKVVANLDWNAKQLQFRQPPDE